MEMEVGYLDTSAFMLPTARSSQSITSFVKEGAHTHRRGEGGEVSVHVEGRSNATRTHGCPTHKSQAYDAGPRTVRVLHSSLEGDGVGAVLAVALDCDVAEGDDVVRGVRVAGPRLHTKHHNHKHFDCSSSNHHHHHHTIRALRERGGSASNCAEPPSTTHTPSRTRRRG